MDFLSDLQGVRGFSGQSNLRRRIAHGQLVTGNPDGTIRSVTHKIHFWRTFLFFGGGYSLSVSCPGIQTEMALWRAPLLYSFLHLQFGIHSTSSCSASPQSLSTKLAPISCCRRSGVR